MKILVTGATGFVGSHVVKKLLKEGHGVRILRRQKSSTQLLAGLPVETAIGDVTDRSSVLNAVNGCEIVFHVAGLVSFWAGNEKLQKKINVDGTRNVVEACLQYKVRRLIHTSSIAALGYAPEGKLGNENTDYNWWPYRISYNNTKHWAEEEVRQGIQRGLDAVFVNPAVIFGPGDLNLNAGAIVFQIARRNLPVYFEGGCCVCDVEDVAQGQIQAWLKGKTGERYILGGENYSWKELFTLIAEVIGVPPPKWKIPIPLLTLLAYGYDRIGRLKKKEPPLTPESIRISAVPCFYSSDKAIRELGYTITPFRETIRKTYEWYKTNKYLRA